MKLLFITIVGMMAIQVALGEDAYDRFKDSVDRKVVIDNADNWKDIENYEPSLELSDREKIKRLKWKVRLIIKKYESETALLKELREKLKIRRARQDEHVDEIIQQIQDIDAHSKKLKEIEEKLMKYLA